MGKRVIAFEVVGPVRGKARVQSRGKQRFKDAKTRKAETSIGWAAKIAMAGQPLLEGPLEFDAVIWVEPPASWPKSKRDKVLNFGPDSYVASKPDWDNQGKLLADALNGIVFKDDCQISDGRVRRRYRATAGADILIRELSDEWIQRRGACKKVAA